MEHNERSYDSAVLIDRRRDDDRINKLSNDITLLTSDVRKMQRTTEKVEEFLSGLRGLYRIAKWVTAIGSLVLMVIAFFKGR